MTWKFPNEELSHLRLHLWPESGATHLSLAHSGLGDEAPNYLTGWHVHLLYFEDLLLGKPGLMAEFWETYERLAKQAPLT